MYKHTITKVRPSVDVEWPTVGQGKVSISQKYNLTPTIVTSDDQLTRSISRQSEDQSVFTSIENDLANPSSDLYWITQYCNDNNITSTNTLEQI
jgi:hypothetical protein